MTSIVILQDPESSKKWTWNWDLEEFHSNRCFEKLPEHLERFKTYKNKDILNYLESKRSQYSIDDFYLFVENIDSYILDSD